MRRCAVLLSVVALLLTAGGGVSHASTEQEGEREETTVFLAASLQPLFLALSGLSPLKMRLVPASSGLLARQISAGAPADLYITADPHWADWLDRSVYLARRPLLSNRLALIMPEGLGGEKDFFGELSSIKLKRIFLSNRVERLAIGDPMHVPAGRYAARALRSLGLSLTEPSGFIIPLVNVRAVVLHMQRKEADLGIVYHSDALQASSVRVVGLFPESLYGSIRYDMLLLNSRARRLYEFLYSSQARRLYRRFGFIPL